MGCNRMSWTEEDHKKLEKGLDIWLTNCKEIDKEIKEELKKIKGEKNDR
jgi:hypothetical protein